MLVLVVGRAFTVTVTEFVNTEQPLAKAVTVYWVVTAGLATTAEPVVLLKEPAGAQEYVTGKVPVFTTLKLALVDAQMVTGADMVN